VGEMNPSRVIQAIIHEKQETVANNQAWGGVMMGRANEDGDVDDEDGQAGIRPR
jgi:hypothetical protein